MPLEGSSTRNAGPDSSSNGGSAAPKSTWKVSKVELCQHKRQQRHKGGLLRFDLDRFEWAPRRPRRRGATPTSARAPSRSVREQYSVISLRYNTAGTIPATDLRRSRCSTLHKPNMAPLRQDVRPPASVHHVGSTESLANNRKSAPASPCTRRFRLQQLLITAFCWWTRCCFDKYRRTIHGGGARSRCCCCYCCC